MRVSSLHEAQYAISKLHRTKVGFKRILISSRWETLHGGFCHMYSSLPMPFSHSHAQNPMILRSKVVSLLSEVPGARLQLFKFREMFEKRYHTSIGVSDLYKMKEVVIVTEEANAGRMVQLNSKAMNSSMLTSSNFYDGSSVASGAPNAVPSSLDLLVTRGSSPLYLNTYSVVFRRPPFASVTLPSPQSLRDGQRRRTGHSFQSSA